MSAARELVAMSDALDAAEARACAVWAEGYRAAEGASYGRAFAEGYAECEAERAAEWHAIAHPVAQPEAALRAVAARALANAESACRRDAAEHERGFAARAYATPPHLRTDVQAACVLAYPPPAAVADPVRGAA